MKLRLFGLTIEIGKDRNPAPPPDENHFGFGKVSASPLNNKSRYESNGDESDAES